MLQADRTLVSPVPGAGSFGISPQSRLAQDKAGGSFAKLISSKLMATKFRLRRGPEPAPAVFQISKQFGFVLPKNLNSPRYYNTSINPLCFSMRNEANNPMNEANALFFTHREQSTLAP